MSLSYWTIISKKFNIDKRRPHLSSQILSECLTREEALRELQKPLYDEIELIQDKSYIAKKLEISVDDLNRFVFDKGHHYSEYSNWDFYYKIMTQLKKLLQKILGRKIKSYS